jgi:hypothetical protein
VLYGRDTWLSGRVSTDQGCLRGGHLDLIEINRKFESHIMSIEEHQDLSFGD